MTDPRSQEDTDQALNPHRREDQRRAGETIAGWLEERDIELDGDESEESLADLLTAVERFEARVRELGGDSMVNTLDSSSPDAPALVLPRRPADEPIERYTARVWEAARRLGAG